MRPLLGLLIAVALAAQVGTPRRTTDLMDEEWTTSREVVLRLEEYLNETSRGVHILVKPLVKDATDVRVVVGFYQMVDLNGDGKPVRLMRFREYNSGVAVGLFSILGPCDVPRAEIAMVRVYLLRQVGEAEFRRSQ